MPAARVGVPACGVASHRVPHMSFVAMMIGRLEHPLVKGESREERLGHSPFGGRWREATKLGYTRGRHTNDTVNAASSRSRGRNALHPCLYAVPA